MRIGGRSGARPAVRRDAKRANRHNPGARIRRGRDRSPGACAGAVGARLSRLHRKSPIPSVHAVITPVAAVSPTVPDLSGPVVIAIDRAPTAFHIAAAAASAPPPPMVVNSPGALGIPTMALSAYRNAEQMMAVADPGLRRQLEPAGRHRAHRVGARQRRRHRRARHRGRTRSTVPRWTARCPATRSSFPAAPADRVTYARAMGPMQFLPGTWARYASDGDGDGKADPQNLFDATLAAARYLCSGGLNLRDPVAGA